MVRTREIYIPREGGGDGTPFQIVGITRVESISILNLLGVSFDSVFGGFIFLVAWSCIRPAGEYADFP